MHTLLPLLTGSSPMDLRARSGSEGPSMHWGSGMLEDLLPEMPEAGTGLDFGELEEEGGVRGGCCTI